MSVRLIFNPNSGSASDVDEVHAAAEARGWEVVETKGPGDGAREAVRAAHDGCTVVGAVGGDGTVNDIAQGLILLNDKATSGDRRPSLLIVPMGTGNDLARTLEIPTAPADALAVYDDGVVVGMDAIAVHTSGKPVRYAVNVCAGGFAGAVDDILEDSDIKRFWGPLAYVRGALEALRDLDQFRVRLQFDDHEAFEVDALNIVIANGRWAGGGADIAPDADPSDGLIDVVVVRDAPQTQLLGVAARLLMGDYRNADNVMHHRCRSVSLASDPPMACNVDGDLYIRGDARFEVRPAALDVYVPSNWSLRGIGSEA